MATGGALSFFVGDIERAPEWVSRLSFEWLWRLVHEPARLWRRYLIEDIAALPVFAGMVLKRMVGSPLSEPELVLRSDPKRRSLRSRHTTPEPIRTDTSSAIPAQIEALAS